MCFRVICDIFRVPEKLRERRNNSSWGNGDWKRKLGSKYGRGAESFGWLPSRQRNGGLKVGLVQRNIGKISKWFRSSNY